MATRFARINPQDGAKFHPLIRAKLSQARAPPLARMRPAPYLRVNPRSAAMDTKPAPFVPPAPRPRQSPPSTLQMMRIVYNNPLELWGEPSYNEKWISISTGIGGPTQTTTSPFGVSAAS